MNSSQGNRMQYYLIIFLVQLSIWFMEERSSNVCTPSRIMSTSLQLAMCMKRLGTGNENETSIFIVELTENL
jgi:hypothetical protein